MRSLLNGFATAGAGLTLLLAQTAGAVTYGFGDITIPVSTADATAGQAQLSVAVSSLSGNRAEFDFHNTGLTAMTIAQIYFDNAPHVLATFDSFVYPSPNPADVAFGVGANPANLPGGGSFVSDYAFGADSPSAHHGVNPGGFVGIVFDLAAGKMFTDVTNDLDNGTLQLGLHVIAFGPDGLSQAFTDTTSGGGGSGNNNGSTGAAPELATSFLAGLGLLTLGLRVGGRNRNRQ